MRLIDADALLNEMQFEREIYNGEARRGFNNGMCSVYDAPTIDAEPVVRCKNCKHWNEEDHWCNIRDSYGWDYKPDDYCSYGER